MQFTSTNPTVKLELCEILYLVEDAGTAVVNATRESVNKNE